jgi:formate hydrogenlyase transcriptional activator
VRPRRQGARASGGVRRAADAQRAAQADGFSDLRGPRGAELARLRLLRTLADSEQRFRDLYEEAPIAYVLEDLDSRFLSANRAALRMLGLRPDEVAGTLGLSFVADIPNAQRRAREALALGRPRHGWGRRRARTPPQGQWPPGVGAVVVPARTRRQVHAHHDGGHTERVLLEQERARLQAQNLYLQEELQSVHNFEEIIGQSRALMAVLDNVCRVAPTDASVLISGETGTGKELIARAIHFASMRKDKPLIKVNCAALPTGLVESELLGHEKGAFTGALAKRLGRFELANGGTLFLDEVGEIPLDVQVKLLRVLQEHEFERLGGSAPIPVDVRIIAASNRDLARAVRERTFREDLYYRLNVFPLALPPLRERSDDIPLLAHFFASKFMTRIGKRLQGIERQSMQRLLAYPWPGNVRELENIIERAVILAQGDTLEIGPDLLPTCTQLATGGNGDRGLTTLERNHILTVLGQTDWVIDGPRGAARILGIHPNTLRSRMKKLGITRPAHERS